MAANAPKNPAHFKIRGTDGILARNPEANLWIGVGFSGLDDTQLETLFERNDEQIEAAAVDYGFECHWITPDEARELRVREDGLLTCKPGEYPWDDWQREALAAGVLDELASLGQAVMREAHQHSWCEDLKDECGAGREDAAMCCHTFRATGITVFLENGGAIETAAQSAAHDNETLRPAKRQDRIGASRTDPALKMVYARKLWRKTPSLL